jgi:hypothetical protein
MADLTSVQPEDASTSAIWGQLILSLHGILTGGDAPLHPVKPFWNDGGSEIQPMEDDVIETEVEKVKDTPAKLKLVLPSSNGKSQEFCINLSPDINSNGS